MGILYISHRMDEIRRIATRVTVMRDGRRIGTHPAVETTSAMLVREMVGHDLPDRPSVDARTHGEVALRVRDLHSGDRVCGVNLEVLRGEILGSRDLSARDGLKLCGRFLAQTGPRKEAFIFMGQRSRFYSENPPKL